MKISFYKMALIVIASTVIYGCQEKDDVLPQNPIVGEWKAPITGKYIQILLNGIEKNPTEIGMEVFQLNETSAGPYFESFLQDQILGPIDLHDGSIVFNADNSLVSYKDGENLEGIWSLYNSQTRLKMEVDGLPMDQYDFDFRQLSASEMELKYSSELILFSENEPEVHNLMVLIRMIKD